MRIFLIQIILNLTLLHLGIRGHAGIVDDGSILTISPNRRLTVCFGRIDDSGIHGKLGSGQTFVATLGNFDAAEIITGNVNAVSEGGGGTVHQDARVSARNLHVMDVIGTVVVLDTIGAVPVGGLSGILNGQVMHVRSASQEHEVLAGIGKRDGMVLTVDIDRAIHRNGSSRGEISRNRDGLDIGILKGRTQLSHIGYICVRLRFRLGFGVRFWVWVFSSNLSGERGVLVYADGRIGENSHTELLVGLHIG